MKTQTYKDLIVWQKSKKLAIEIYALTGQVSSVEKFGIISQFNRAAISIPLNIAEGYRRRGNKERRQLFSIAFGSGAEIEALIDICKDLPNLKNLDFSKAESLLDEVLRMLNVFIKNSSSNPTSYSPNSPRKPTRYSLNSKFSSKGFSLLELLLYMAILSIISVVLGTTFISLTKGRAQSESRTEVNSNMRFALERITQDVNSASLVNLPVFAGSGSSLELVVGGHTVLYDVSSGQLRRTIDAGTPDRITGTSVTVDPPVFTRIENYNSVLLSTTTTIQTQLIIRYNSSSPEWTYSSSVKSSASFR